jgi:hypothetical protein
MSTTPTDPMEFIKSLWGNTGMPLPGLVTPTMDTNELDKRITDLKAVEGWLKTNLGMLQMTIQGLEVQRATLSAFQAISQSLRQSGAVAVEFHAERRAGSGGECVWQRGNQRPGSAQGQGQEEVVLRHCSDAALRASVSPGPARTGC